MGERGLIWVVAVLAAGALGAAGTAWAGGDGPEVVAYGHSWPAGYHVREPYPQRVADGLGMGLVNRARSGDLAAGTAARVETRPPGRDDVVIVEAGLNDARAYGLRGLPVFRDFLSRALWRLRRVDRVVLVLEQPIPRWRGFAPYNLGSPAVIRAYDAAVVEIAQPYPNVTTVRVPLEPDDWQDDGVHPDGSGHARIARAVIRAASPRSAAG